MGKGNVRISTNHLTLPTVDIGAPTVVQHYRLSFDPDASENIPVPIDKNEIPKIDFTRWAEGLKKVQTEAMMSSEMDFPRCPIKIQEFFESVPEFKRTGDHSKRHVVAWANVMAHVAQLTQPNWASTIYAIAQVIRDVPCLVLTKKGGLQKPANKEQHWKFARKLGILVGLHLTSKSDADYKRRITNSVVDYYFALSTLNVGDVKVWILAEIDGIYGDNLVEIKVKKHFSQLDLCRAFFSAVPKIVYTNIRAIDIAAGGFPTPQRVKFEFGQTSKMINEEFLARGKNLIAEFMVCIFAYFEDHSACTSLFAKKKPDTLFFQLEMPYGLKSGQN